MEQVSNHQEFPRRSKRRTTSRWTTGTNFYQRIKNRNFRGCAAGALNSEGKLLYAHNLRNCERTLHPGIHYADLCGIIAAFNMYCTNELKTVSVNARLTHRPFFELLRSTKIFLTGFFYDYGYERNLTFELWWLQTGCSWGNRERICRPASLIC